MSIKLHGIREMLSKTNIEKMKREKRKREDDIRKGKKIGPYILPKSVITEMQDSIKKSDSINKEIGFSLCYKTIEPDILIDRSHCTGTECSIKQVRKCEDDEILSGDFHTHPRTKDIELSGGDIAYGYRMGLICVGSGKKISCYLRKRIYQKSIDNEIIEMVKMQKTIETQLNIIEKMNEELKKERPRIIKENFDTTYIK